MNSIGRRRIEQYERKIARCIMDVGANVLAMEQKLPIVGDYFIRETPASDNVSAFFNFG